MDSRDFFRRFFGLPRDPASPFSDSGSRDDGACRDEFSVFFGDSSRGLEGMFEHFHGDMWRQMDALHRQMDEMMRGFGAIDFHSGLDLPPLQPSEPVTPGKPHQGHQIFSWTLIPDPFFRRQQQEKKSPRDFMLKDGADDLPEKQVVPGISDRPKFGGMTPPAPFSIPGSHNKIDSDLDGKISEDKLLELIKQPNESLPSFKAPATNQEEPRVFSASKSVSVTTVRGPDNKLEHKRTVRDSSGHEESTVTRTLGDKTYSVTTVRDKDGNQQQQQTFTNMDESQVAKFEDEWNKKKKQVGVRSPGESMLSVPQDIDDKGLFGRLFGWKD